ncbi:MAG: hypothetical protein ACYDBH_01100 [Acidobacteriaceae bacterium]
MMSGYINPTAPNLQDFTTFLQTELAIPASVLPSDSPWIGYAFNRAMALTLQVQGVSPDDYVHVVYCCGAHIQLTITPDQPGMTYFADAQKSFGLSSPISGMVSGSADQGTSGNYAVPDAMKRLTFQDLQFSQTPWGRTWLGWGQDFGSPWGIT